MVSSIVTDSIGISRTAKLSSAISAIGDAAGDGRTNVRVPGRRADSGIITGGDERK